MNPSVEQPPLRVRFLASFSHEQGTYFRWHNLARALRSLGLDVTVYAVTAPSFGPTQRHVRDGVPYHLVPLTPGFGRFSDHRLDPLTLCRLFLKTRTPSDVTHIFQPFPHSSLPGLLNRQRSKTLIFDWDDYWTAGFQAQRPHSPAQAHFQNAVTALEHALPSKCNAVTVCSNYLAQRANQYGSRATQIIHNGFWPTAEPGDVAAARESLGLVPSAFYFGFMGRTLGELTWCMDALSEVRSSSMQVRLALCGMSEQALATLPPELQHQIDYLGHLPPDRIQTFATAIDCGLLPLEDNVFNQSRFPIKFAEYLAGSAHVVCSEVGEVASLAPLVGSVSLAGTTRQDWRSALTSLDLPSLRKPATVTQSPALSRLLSWPFIAQNLARFYSLQLGPSLPHN